MHILILLRQAWYDYCLINPSGRPDKFMADDRFGERIVLLNKEKVRPSANAKSDELLREIVALNVLSLWKCKEAVSRATGATSHGNCHSLVAKLPDISLLVKHMTENSIFHEQLGRTGMRNNNAESALPNLFSIGVGHLSTGVALSQYINSARGNWDNYNKNKDNNIDNESDDDPVGEHEDPGQQHEPDSLYD